MEAILNETKAAREVQEDLLETINYKLEGIINNIEATNEKLTSQQNIMEDIEDMQETLVSEVAVLVNNTNFANTQLATLITEIQDIEFNQTVIASSNINDSSTINNKLGDIYNELSGVRQEAEDYHRLSQQWYTQPNVFVSFASCEDIKTMSPSAPSGYYNITKHDGTTQRVYCDIERSHLYGVEESSCGSTGWTKVAYLNMSDPLQQCPTEFRLYNENGMRACGRQTSSGGRCDSQVFYTNGTSYTEVCGRVIGYQYGRTYASTYGDIQYRAATSSKYTQLFVSVSYNPSFASVSCNPSHVAARFTLHCTLCTRMCCSLHAAAHACYLQGKDACMNMHMSHAWSGHVMCMSYACHQMTHVICMLHGYNMRLPCACQMHVGENRSSYEGVITSELIFLIPIYVWADCVTSPSHISIFSKIGKKLNSEQKTSACCVHVQTCTQHAHVIRMLSA